MVLYFVIFKIQFIIFIESKYFSTTKLIRFSNFTVMANISDFISFY